MSKIIELTDEQYSTLTEAARGKKAEVLPADLIDEVRDSMTHARYYETDDWFRHLGATEEQEEQIEASTKRVREEAEMS
jgi:hypothetical protein